MATAHLDVVGIGNAIVDVLAHAEDAFLDAWDLSKGTMTLVDAERAAALYDAMGPAVEVSGGSAANSVAVLAGLGARCAFVGKIRDDQLGQIFRHDIVSLGVTFSGTPAADGPPTGRCLILVTPDAQRTMQTSLGIGGEIGPDDVDHALIAGAKVTYLEGYLWDRPAARDAFVKAAEIAHGSGHLVAFSLSDPFCVDRHRADFVAMVNEHVDVLFANEDEVVSLYQVHAFDDALQRARRDCKVAALTRSAKGSVIVSGQEVHIVDACPVEHVIDTTGAGDAYAAGFVYGLTRGLRLQTCGRIGALCAAEIIGHFGARPEADLKELIRQTLG
jgi:sugar/nucleoside kinase (ribokinase family)